MIRFSIAVLTISLLLPPKALQAQESTEIKRLNDKIALLEEKLALAEEKIKVRDQQIEQLKAKPTKSPKEDAKKDLSDLLPVGAVVTGNWRSLNKPDKDGNFGSGTISITITDRDGGKFKADSIITNQSGVTTNSSIQGLINGVKLSWETVGNASQIKASLVRKGEDALEGNYQIPTTRDGGTVALKLPKVGN